jgi:LmbE family N-acetylglucosaminyl deacetylase
VTSLVTVVLAPHYDDEVLGCGGLVARLARAGTRVHVVFLTDGAGGAESIDDRAAYSARRRAESVEALRELGVASAEHLDLPDGSLASSLDRLRTSIERVILAQRPDLLLLPSPLEITADHRAVFAALHRVLTPLRRGRGEAATADAPGAASRDALHDVATPLRVLAYEVNHAAHPDLLVDVSSERPTIERAMVRYASQLERHGYLEAGLGLRRWRCSTLQPGVELAEAYRGLRLIDFQTRTLAQLIAELGGVPELHEVNEGPLVSIVVRTKDRARLLAEALASIAASTYRRLEVVLVNDGGAKVEPPAGFTLPVVRVDLDANRGRAAAANAGVAAARGSHVLFLDDDDLIAPEHVATLVDLAVKTGARVAYTDAAVGVYELDAGPGWRLRARSLPYSRDFDPDLLLFDNYIPFHTVLIERALHQEAGPFDEALEFFEDWDLLIRLSRLVRFQHLPVVTCEYRHFRGAAHALGEMGEARVDFVATKARVLEKHHRLHGSDAVARAIVTLRREGVAAAQDAEARRARLDEMERAYHLRNGELETVREESERRARALADHDADFERLHREEALLRRGIEEQLEHLGRTYAEIERLNSLVGAVTADRDRGLQLIEAMKGTRAWRLHEWWQRLRS